ncbi:MAG: FapA family protein [Desulfovibrio sp.]|jgi:uncharacterized protein (DUF342 family)|nr:FapA family protein [Desulfovibrio sp.]
MYYLHHYFDPDFSHVRLTPSEEGDGTANPHYLGYVQNVIAGQVLAESVDLEQFPDMPCDPRFIYPERHLPVGPNCEFHRENPDRIVAAANGYVFYHNGLISVKKLLNVRGDVGFRTGNILFVGDLAIHGDVLTDFSIRANNVLVKGHIESAKVKAVGDLVCLSGIKGANPSMVEDEPIQSADADGLIPSTLIEAGGNVRLPFCEHVQIRAGGNLIIDGSCLHSTLYVGGSLIIKGRLQGGAVYANNVVYVEGQFGSDYTSTTKVMMGYNPFDFLTMQKLESQIAYLKNTVTYFEKMAARNAVMEQEYRPRVHLMARKLKIAHAKRTALWGRFSVDEQNAPKCRVIVPGKVMPGCEIGIAKAFYKTHDMGSNLSFSLVDDEIVSKSPAARYTQA